MTDNPYQAPEAEILNPATPSEAAGFYVVARKKMILLSVFTHGLYLIYWFYRNWKLRKQVTGARIWPVARAIFSIFFVHALFREAEDVRSRSQPQLPAWNHSQAATVIVLLLIISRVIDRLSAKSIGSPVTDYISILLLFPTIACFVSAQSRINEACGDPEGISNSLLTGANYAWIALGAMMWILAVIGIFVTEV